MTWSTNRLVDLRRHVVLGRSDFGARREPRGGVQLLQRYGDNHLVTSNHVCGESWTFLRRRYGHGAAVRFVDRLRRSTRVRIAFVSEQLEEQAWSWLRRRDEREYSFVDAASFALMRSLRIREVLTFDEDFDAAGFVRLRP